jgi:folate-binding protein YgfZ
MNSEIIILKDRSLLEVQGADSKKFLQSLITNDINKLASHSLIYSALLNPQGRFLYDFFIFEIGNKIYIDCYEGRVEEIFKKLRFYKLRSLVDIKIVSDFKVAQIIGVFDDNSLKLTENDHIYQDPRNKEIGLRIYSKDLGHFTTQNQLIIAASQNNYHLKRILLKIAEGEYDLIYDKSFILEYDFDNLNAIDYKKGCYVGQEVTARTHYRGQIRKKLFHIQIDLLDKIDKGVEVNDQQKAVGLILSSVFSEGKLNALALIKIADENLTLKNLADQLRVMDNKITIIS